MPTQSQLPQKVCLDDNTLLCPILGIRLPAYPCQVLHPSRADGQTTPLLELPAENGRRPFTLTHLIEIDEYCRKRDFGLQLGPEYLEMFWGFEALQR